MTRHGCEEKLLDLMEQAVAIYRECIPDAGALSFYINREGMINVYGYGHDTDMVILHVTRFSDGETWHSERWAEVMQEEQA